MTMLVVLVWAGLLLIVLARSLAIVPRGTVHLVERLGRYHRTLDAGLSFVAPFVDHVRAEVPLGERLVDLPPSPAVSLDNHALSLSGVLTYRVIDARRAVYDVADYEQAIAMVAVRALRTAVGRLEAAHAGDAAAEAEALAGADVGVWGLEVLAIEAEVAPAGR